MHRYEHSNYSDRQLISLQEVELAKQEEDAYQKLLALQPDEEVTLTYERNTRVVYNDSDYDKAANVARVAAVYFLNNLSWRARTDPNRGSWMIVLLQDTSFVERETGRVVIQIRVKCAGTTFERPIIS